MGIKLPWMKDIDSTPKDELQEDLLKDETRLTLRYAGWVTHINVLVFSLVFIFSMVSGALLIYALVVENVNDLPLPFLISLVALLVSVFSFVTSVLNSIQQGVREKIKDHISYRTEKGIEIIEKPKKK